MPTYDYRCDACKHTLELFQKITESPKKKCPACKKSRLKRLIGGGAGFLFKGSGFYLTDYRSDSYKKSAESDSKSASAADKPAADSPSTDKPSTEKSEKKGKSEAPAAPAKSDGGGSGGSSGGCVSFRKAGDIAILAPGAGQEPNLVQSQATGLVTASGA